MKFEYPIKREPGNFDCACADCDNEPVMYIGEERYCYECGVPVLMVTVKDARAAGFAEGIEEAEKICRKFEGECNKTPRCHGIDSKRILALLPTEKEKA